MKEKIGWVLIIIGVLLPIAVTAYSFAEPSGLPLGARIGFLCRFWVTAPVLGGIGAKLVSDAHRRKMSQGFEKLEKLKNSFCMRCDFADKAAMLTGQPWCRAPRNPDIDEEKAICFSIALREKVA